MRQIKSLLLFHSVEIPFPSNPFIEWLHGLDLGDEYLNKSINSLVALFDYLSAEKKRFNQEVVELAKEEKYAERVTLLESIPGIGTLSEIEILVEVQDINCFETADELATYLGLTPSQYSSGEHIRMGHIAHAGNDRVRTTLVKSSWLLIGKDLHMRWKQEKIKHRRGEKRSIIAVARTFSARIRRIVLNQVP